MQIGGGPYSVVSESPVCSRSTARRMLAEAVEHTFTPDEAYCSAGIFVRSQVRQVTTDMASSANSSNDSHPNTPRCLAFCNRRQSRVRSTVSFALGIDGRGLSKEFLWRADNKGWDLATSAGATATMVAGYRAAATKRDQPLIGVPFADQLVPRLG